MIIINDQNFKDHTHPYDKDGVSSSGYVRKPDGSTEGASVCAAFPQELLIPEVEWAERYEEMKAKDLFLSSLCRRAVSELGVRWLNQNPTNYCWCYAVVQAIMVLRLHQNEPYRRLVPASVAGPIKNYKNVGGWGSQALDYIVQHGVADESVWPQETAMKAIDERYFAGSRANAATTKIVGFYKITNLHEKMSCMFRYMCVPSGYGWMGHEMNSIDPFRDARGEWGTGEMDSYADKDGMFNYRAIVGKKCVGEDMVSPIAITSEAA